MKKRCGTTNCLGSYNFVWEKAFHNVDVNKQVMLFNETVLNIIRNLISHETLTFDDREPPWITSCIKEKMIDDSNLAFKRFVNEKGFANNSSNLERFSCLQNKLTSLIETSKQKNFPKIAKKLSEPSISLKTY